MTQLFDFSTLDLAVCADTGADLALLHPVSGVPLGPVITLAGSDSAAYRTAQTKIANKRLQQQGSNQITADAIRNNGIEILAACTRSWSGVVVDGVEPPCTPDNARILYSRFDWVREQVDAFVAERGNYLRD